MESSSQKHLMNCRRWKNEYPFYRKRLPTRIPPAIGAMSAAELNIESQKGYDDINAGYLHDLDDVVAEEFKY